MSPEPPKFASQDRNRLTLLAGRMLDAACDPGQGRVRAIVMLSDPDHPGDESCVVAISGYEPGELPGELVADVAVHAGALGRTYGVPIALVLGALPPDGDIPYDEPLEPPE
jgi:hypothetical protein